MLDADQDADRDGELSAAREEATRVLAAWGMTPTEIQVVGAAPGMAGTILRPVGELRGKRYLLRRQPPGLTAADLRFRHAFSDHLTRAGLPVPTLLARPDGATCTITENGVYEAQEWLEGEPFASDEATAATSMARVEAAGQMLGRLHQASADFSWQPHIWPEERSGDGLARAYIGLMRQAAEHSGASAAVAHGLARIADACEERREPASAALATQPAPPQLHIHGDYQPHNLRFTPVTPGAPTAVSAIFDFDAARWDTRLLELAYSLLFITGVRWDDPTAPTPPLVDDGLDILAARRYLGAYGREAPPAEDEAPLLGDALALVFPIVFVNGVAEDLIFPDDFEDTGSDENADEEDALARLHWADTFWLWLDRYRDALAQAWHSGA